MSEKIGKVCIDPGHDWWAYNRSPVVSEYCEGQRMWDLALLLKEQLEDRNVTVLMTKEHVNHGVSLGTRGRMSKGYDLMVSLHSDAAAREEPDWVSALHQLDDKCGPMDARSKEVAKRLCEAVAALMGVGTRLTFKESDWDRDGNGYRDDYYGVLRSAHTVGTPAVLIEHGFHTNEKCTRWLLDDENLLQVAITEAEVIVGWLKEVRQAEKVTFVKDIQAVIGAAVDGIPGPETICKTVTLSAKINSSHPAVQIVQQRLNALGYTQVGKADGIAGKKFTAAVKAFQQENGCVVDGEITAKCKTWRRLLGMA